MDNQKINDNDNGILSIVAFMSNLGFQVTQAPSYILEKAESHGIKHISHTLQLGGLDNKRLHLFFNWFDTWKKQLAYNRETGEQIDIARKYIE